VPTRASTSLAPVSLGKFFRGVDISKTAPDVAILLGGESFRVTNNPEGHRDLIKGLKGSDVARMVFEATGAYHRLLQQALADNRCCRLPQPIATQAFQRNRPEARLQDGALRTSGTGARPPQIIQTERGVGYVFAREVER